MIISSIALSFRVSTNFFDEYIISRSVLSIVISQLFLYSFQIFVTLIGNVISFVIHLIVRSQTTLYQSRFFVKSLDTKSHVGNVSVLKKSSLFK